MSSATSWPWQRLNQGNASSHQVLAGLLEPAAGERWLDVGTGGGGLALELARSGARVTGVDVAADGLEHARTAATEHGLDVELVQGDAQSLPFEAAAFDGVASAFGVIFAADRERAAQELARVCRPAGKLGLTLMPRDSRAGAIFELLARFGRADPHPAEWEARVEELLAEDFELELERRESPASAPIPDPSWEERLRSFAPLREAVAQLDDEAVAELRDELARVDERYRDRPPSYVLVLGRRR